MVGVIVATAAIAPATASTDSRKGPGELLSGPFLLFILWYCMIVNIFMSDIIVNQNIKKDAWNWWQACNRVSYGMDWKQRVDKKIQNKLVGKTKQQAMVFLIPYLKKVYKKLKINQSKKEIQNIFKQSQKEIFLRMEKMTGRKIYRKNFICFLTTFPRAPYNYSRGHVWLPVIWPRETVVRAFVHELLHFQTYAYWKKRCLKRLTNTEFENLKEALTVILNEEFMDLIMWPDKGYPMHKNLRAKLLIFWRKNKNFDKLIDYGVKNYFVNTVGRLSGG